MNALTGNSIEAYVLGFKSDATRETYLKKLRQFLSTFNLTPDQFLELAQTNPKEAEKFLIRYISQRKDEVSGSTIRGLKEAVKAFLLMNDVENGINWEKISRMMPHARKVGQDRAPTVEEVREILANCDLRMKAIILLLVSGGMRIGAFDYLRWKDVEPVKLGDQEFAKVTVYRGEPEQYTTFVTPEAYRTLVEYRERRKNRGDNLTSETYLIGHERVTSDKPVSSQTIKNIVIKLLWEIGMRKEHKRVQEFIAVHGFRKFFETNAKRILRAEDVERLKGHLSNYYKPTDEYLASEYVKAVPYLTVSEAFELKGKLDVSVKEKNEKIGELERENLALRREVQEIKEQVKLLGEMIAKRKH
jgi:integrase